MKLHEATDGATHAGIVLSPRARALKPQPSTRKQFMNVIAKTASGIAAAILLCTTGRADVSVAWTSPPNGSIFNVGVLVNPLGQASASGGVGGSGLDLALVLDSSGSMGLVESGKSRQQWQKDAAIALVNALPTATTSVAVIEFDSDASTVRMLSPLTTEKALIIAAINSVDASGGTTIGSGIDLARVQLTGPLHTAGRSQQMVVMSDGESSGLPGENADVAAAAGIDAIHSIGMPGHSALTMQRIVDGPDDSYANAADNYGIYTGVSNLTALEALFNGTAGNLVGIDHVEITLPNGTVINPAAIDGLGNFSTSWTMQLGANTFTARAYDTDGNSAVATLTLNGVSGPGVPDAGATAGLLGIGLVALAALRRRLRA